MINVEDTPIDNIHDNFDTLMCFLESANSLRALAYDGIGINASNNLGKPTNDYWYEHLFTAFYLYRHAIELALKALIKSICKKNIFGHDLEKIWDTIPLEEKNKFDAEFLKEINEVFHILSEFNVLKDEQLFRYHNNKSISINKLRNIKYRDFEILYGGAYSIRQAVLETIDKDRIRSHTNTNHIMAEDA